MHPINKNNFGSSVGKISITFHNGSSAVTGYIVKQIGSKRFVVTVDGTTTYTVQLAQTTADATALVAGAATIAVTPFGGSVEHVKSVASRVLTTTEGNSYTWVIGTASVAGQGGVAAIVAKLVISGTPAGAKVGTAYSFSPAVTGGAGTKTFALTGTLPAGLVFSTATGSITGTPTAAGTTSGLAIAVTDTSGTANLSNLSIVVDA